MNGFELITEERYDTSLIRKLMQMASTTYSISFAKLMQMASNLSSYIDNEDDIINEIKKLIDIGE